MSLLHRRPRRGRLALVLGPCRHRPVRAVSAAEAKADRVTLTAVGEVGFTLATWLCRLVITPEGEPESLDWSGACEPALALVTLCPVSPPPRACPRGPLSSSGPQLAGSR